MSGSSPLDPAAFREGMARFASGVTVVTTRDSQGGPVGFTATSFSSVSLDPPLVLACLDRRADSLPSFQSAGHFAISILSSHQADYALRFAAKGTDKFAGVDVELGAVTGLPLLPDVCVQLECRKYDELSGGDHIIILGEVLGVATSDKPPLLHFNRRFGGFQPAEG
jgi:flavin reductase (DIM6/NTAB) family NADH-FMN oxidoreductase RutF